MFWLNKLMYYGCVVVLFCPLICMGQKNALVMGDTIYRYSSLYLDELPKLNAIDFSTYNFACVERFEITESEVPNAKYKLKSVNGYEELFSLEKGVLTYKGFKGKEPFFDIPNTYIQFISGIPLIAIDEASRVTKDGEASYYLEYKLEKLPDELQSWLVFNDYSKLRLRVNIDYRVKYEGAFDESGPEYLVSSSYLLTVDEINGKRKKWLPLTLPKKLSQKYFGQKKVAYESLIEEGSGFESIRVYTEPEQKMVFHTNKQIVRSPDCQYEGTQLYVYPNPTYTDLNISYTNLDKGLYKFDIYNIIGFPFQRQQKTDKNWTSNWYRILYGT